MENNLEELILTCSHWSTYRARMSNRRVSELVPFEHNLDPSPTGAGMIDVQGGPARIDSPMVCKSWLEGGPVNKPDLRGVDPFVEINWDEAKKPVVIEIMTVRKNYGNRAIFSGPYGWASAGRFHHAHPEIIRNK